MSSCVAVAGGTGSLGRPMVEALQASGKFKVFVLSRSVNADFEKATGVKMLAADYTNVASLVELLETNQIDTVIATFGVASSPSNETNLIEAAEKSSVTRRFIPNTFSLVPYTEKLATNPPAASMVDVISRLGKSETLEWTTVRPGIFLDYYVPGLPSYVQHVGPLVDIDKKFASLPGTGDTPVPMTWTFDIGKYIAALVGKTGWEHYYFIQGDKQSYNQVIAAAEKAQGVKYKVAYHPVEMLKQGEITEMPSFKEIANMFGGGDQAMGMVKRLVCDLGVAIEEGHVNYKGPFLNELFADIKPLTLEEAWKQVA